MPALMQDAATAAVIRRPGFYRLDRADGVLSESAPGPTTSGGLVSSLLGDFAAAPTGDRGASGGLILNGRRPLGGLALLAEADTIDVTLPDGARRRLTYTIRGPAVRTVVQAHAKLTCAYSTAPLAGAEAVRCSACRRVYLGQAAWDDELRRTCPACAWSERAEEARP